MHPYLTEIARGLSDTVPFVGPEAIERRTGMPIRARIGANESGFGPSSTVETSMRRLPAARGPAERATNRSMIIMLYS